MSSPKVLVRESKQRGRGRSALPLPDTAWYLLGGLGFIFVLVAGADILLAWYPPSFGMAQWRFGTVTTSLNSYPLLVLGLVLTGGAGVARGRRGWTRAVSVVLLVLVLLTLAEAVLYLPTIGEALKSAENETIRHGLRSQIIKTVIQLIAYPLILAWIAVLSWRASST